MSALSCGAEGQYKAEEDEDGGRSSESSGSEGAAEEETESEGEAQEMEVEAQELGLPGRRAPANPAGSACLCCLFFLHALSVQQWGAEPCGQERVAEGLAGALGL